MKYDHYNVLEKKPPSLCIFEGNSTKPYNPINPQVSIASSARVSESS